MTLEEIDIELENLKINDLFTAIKGNVLSGMKVVLEDTGKDKVNFYDDRSLDDIILEIEEQVAELICNYDIYKWICSKMEIYVYRANHSISSNALFIVGFMFIEPAIAKHKIKNNNEYGSARFATFNEIKNNFKKEKIESIKESGVPIWFSNDYKFVWFDRETPHYTYLGSTGSGKSVTAVIPMCSFIATAKKKRSVFITDPKGEIFNTTSLMFKQNGYNVITIDFRHPEMSNHFNILEPIIKEYEKYIEYEKCLLMLKKIKLNIII